jgi:MFS family permease
MPNDSSIELTSISASQRNSTSETNDADNPNHHPEFSLPPVDGGKDAWLFLAAAFVVEALVWGFPFSFGIFQEYYSTHEPFQGSGNIAVIGTCAMGIMYIDLVVVSGLLVLWPRIQMVATVCGLLVMCLALALSSFSTTTTHLIVTQGIIYAIGGSFAYAPCILYMDQWFVKRKGLAYGIMWAGTGLAGVILPFVMDWLLHTYGFRTTLRAWAICLFLLTGPLLYFVKPRIPVAQTHKPQKIDFTFLRTTAFSIPQLCNIIEALGFFLPSIYLPTYARTLGASSSLSALTLMFFNVASVVGCVMMGGMIDKWHVTTCIMISTVGTAISVFVIWGFSMTLPTLYVFSLAYGLFAGSYTSTWPGIMRDVKKKKENADPSIIFACLSAGRGIGNVISGPLSEVLVKGMAWQGKAGWGYGSGYGSLIVFTGVTAVLGGGSFLGKRVGWL